MKKRQQNVVGAIIIAEDTGRMLLARRSEQTTHPGVWSIITGHMEGKETPQETLVRELREETDLELARVPGIFETVEFDGYLMHLFVISSPSEEEMSLNWENDAAGWFDPRHLPRPYHPGLDTIRLIAIKLFDLQGH